MEQIINPPTSDAGGNGALIKDSTTATFAADVIEGSRQRPVVVDFWAPWCGPCKQLTPMLEKTVRAAGGAVQLIKVNIDENPEIAQSLRIQSVPTVFAFYGGRPIDGFTGALPESEVKAFVKRLTDAVDNSQGPSPVEEALEEARKHLDAGDAGTASALYNQVLQSEPDNVSAIAGLARCHLSAGEADKARHLLEKVPEDQADNVDAQAARAALELAEQAAEAGDVGALEARVEADGDDHQARYDLAIARQAAGDMAGALDALLEIVRRKRDWNEEAARKQLLKIFEALGPAHELTVEGRQRLSTILFA